MLLLLSTHKSKSHIHYSVIESTNKQKEETRQVTHTHNRQGSQRNEVQERGWQKGKETIINAEGRQTVAVCCWLVSF